MSSDVCDPFDCFLLVTVARRIGVDPCVHALLSVTEDFASDCYVDALVAKFRIEGLARRVLRLLVRTRRGQGAIENRRELLREQRSDRRFVAPCTQVGKELFVSARLDRLAILPSAEPK